MPDEWPQPTEIDWPASLEPRSGTVKFIGSGDGAVYTIACHYNDHEHTEVYFHFGDEDNGTSVFAGLAAHQALAIYQRLEDVLSDMGLIEVIEAEDHLSDLDTFDQELEFLSTYGKVEFHGYEHHSNDRLV